MKKFFSIIAILLLLLALGIYWVFGNLDSLLQTQIEKQGSAALNTRVSVQKVELDMSAGFGALRNVAIANPSGFSPQQALQVESAVLNLNTQSLKARPLEVEALRLDGLNALYELNAAGESNLDQLQSALSASETASRTQPSKTSSEASDLRIRIRKLSIAHTALGLNLSALGGEQISQTLPAFEVEDVGGNEGLPPDALGRELARILLDQITRGAARSAMEFVDPAKIKNADQYMDTLEKLQMNLKATGRSFKEGAEQLGDNLKSQWKKWGED